tara:strand:+ start:1982 stop:2116 length:135 start_codon:yes stop_codon:yes gene_type:complete
MNPINWYEEYREMRENWNVLFNLCMKYKQWKLLDEYWIKVGEEE